MVKMGVVVEEKQTERAFAWKNLESWLGEMLSLW